MSKTERHPLKSNASTQLGKKNHELLPVKSGMVKRPEKDENCSLWVVLIKSN